MEQKTIEVEAKGKEYNGKYEHQVDNIAHSHHISKQQAIWDPKTAIKVGEYIIHGLISKEEKSKEASC